MLPDTGIDTPLTLLHGGLLAIETSFGAVLPTLSSTSSTHRTIAVELRGHGRTVDAG